jgi:hypothetical protein
MSAADLHAQGLTWLNGDISANEMYGGDLIKALNAIKASVLLIPGRTDMYFPPDDNALDVGHLARAELRPIPSIWGHSAGAPNNNPPDLAFLRHAVHDWLGNLRHHQARQHLSPTATDQWSACRRSGRAGQKRWNVGLDQQNAGSTAFQHRHSCRRQQDGTDHVVHDHQGNRIQDGLNPKGDQHDRIARAVI